MIGCTDRLDLAIYHWKMRESHQESTKMVSNDHTLI
jgi:hypothetical protein